MFRLEAFGGLVVVDEVGAEVATQHRRLALLALLTVAGARGLTRAKLQAYLWPEGSAESARHGLEQLVYYLRRQIGPELFLGPDPLRLNPDVISTDVGQFEQALACGSLSAAAAVYRGPFLDGFYLSAAPEFERWVEEERSRLGAAYQEALLRLAEGEEAGGRPYAAIDWWRKLVLADPLDTRATLGLMRAMAAAGDRAGALRSAREHKARMQLEFGAPPSHEVNKLIAELCEPEPSPSTVRTPETSTALHAGASDRLLASEDPYQPISANGEHPLPVERPRGSRKLLALGAAVGILATLGVIATLGLRSTDVRFLDPNLVAVAPFEILDPSLDLWREGLVDVLSANLDGAGPLRTVPPTVVIRRWRGRVDRSSTVELGRRTGARLALFGRLEATRGDSVRIFATLLDVDRGEPLAEFELRSGQNELDRLTDSLTVALLREVGRARKLGAIRGGSLGARSLPALRAFLKGEQFYRRYASDSALWYFQRAVALDSAFAMALSRASQPLWTRNDSLARAYALRAGALNRGLAPRESLLLAAESLLASLGPGSGAFDSAASVRTHRLLATLEAAAERYPSDPEVWYLLGDGLFHSSWDSADSLRRVLGALDRAIALDSTFGLPYPHAVEIAGALGDSAGTRQRAIAFLDKARPSSDLGEASKMAADGSELIASLLDPTTSDSGRVDTLLRHASPTALGLAWYTLQGMTDSAEVALRVARITFSRRADPDTSVAWASRILANSNRFLAFSLGYRGHVREAGLILGTGDSVTFPSLFAELSLEGGVLRDTAQAVFERWLHRPAFWPAGGLVFALPFWSAVGDTGSLGEFERQALAMVDSFPVSTSGQRNLDDPRYASAAARAYLALARNDTAEAVTRFADLPLRSCPWCFLERLTYARLLTARARHREALTMLSPGFPLMYSLPTRPVWALERARVAERAGDRRTAAAEYSFVTRVWRHADPVLQPYVAEARAGLERLGRSSQQ